MSTYSKGGYNSKTNFSGGGYTHGSSSEWMSGVSFDHHMSVPWPVEDFLLCMPDVQTSSRRALFELADTFDLWAQQCRAMSSAGGAWASADQPTEVTDGDAYYLAGEVAAQAWTSIRNTPSEYNRDVVSCLLDERGLTGRYGGPRLHLDKATGEGLGAVEVDFVDDVCARTFAQQVRSSGPMSRVEWCTGPPEAWESTDDSGDGLAARLVEHVLDGSDDTEVARCASAVPSSVEEQGKLWGAAGSAHWAALLGAPAAKMSIAGAPVSL